MRNKWQTTYIKIPKGGVSAGKCGKKEQSAGTVRNRPQHLHEPTKSLLKRTEAASLIV